MTLGIRPAGAICQPTGLPSVNRPVCHLSNVVLSQVVKDGMERPGSGVVFDQLAGEGAQHQPTSAK
jgi:hypothetical protein